MLSRTRCPQILGETIIPNADQHSWTSCTENTLYLGGILKIVKKL